MRYRITRRIVVLAFKGDHHAAVSIQPGQIFRIIGPAQDDRFVVVDVQGEEFLVFDSDLKERGKVIPDRTARTAVKPIRDRQNQRASVVA